MADRTRDYVVKSGRFGKTVNGSHVTYSKGDTIALTDVEAKNLGSRVELKSIQGQYEPLSSTIKRAQGIEDDSGENVGTNTPDAQDSTLDSQDWSATLEGMKWNEAVDLINSLETEEDINAAREAEAKGLKRKSVLEAADARLT